MINFPYFYLRIVKTQFMTNEVSIPLFNSSLASRIGLVICGAGIVAIGFFGNIFEYIHYLSFGFVR
jgi:hypothetical protein